MQINQPQNKNCSRRQLLAGLGGFWMLAGTAGPAGAAGPKTVLAEQLDRALPATAITGPDGRDLYLADFAGQPLLVNFWASWCAPCVHELPALETAASQLAGSGGAVLLVCIDRGGQPTAEAFLKGRNIQLKSAIEAYDPKASWARALGLAGLPVSLWMGPDQGRVWIHTGPADWADPAILARMAGLLSG